MYGQNIILIGTVCSQDKSTSTIKWQLALTNNMKIVAALAICFNTLFMALNGVHDDNKSSFAMAYPWIFKNASIIGFKISDLENGIKLTHSEMLDGRIDKLFY